MFGSKKKKKASFDPPAEDLNDFPPEPEDPGYAEPQSATAGGFAEPSSYTPRSYQPMSGRSNPQHILASLATSPNDFAAGIAICVKALADATASPPSTPVMVEYRNRRMAFGRRQLSRLDGHEAIRTMARTVYPQGQITDTQNFLVAARFYAEDGQVARREVGVDLASWDELLPYIQTLYIANEPVNPPPRDRDRDRDRDRERERERERQRERERRPPRRDSYGEADQRVTRQSYPESGPMEGGEGEGYPPPEE